MGSAAGFILQFFPLFLLGAVFGKLMDDSGSVTAIARFMTEKLGPRRAMLAVVLAGALVTYGGVSLFVAFFVLVPMGQALFRAADIPNRLMPAAIALGTMTFTMSALPGTPAIQNAIPDAVLRDHAVRRARAGRRRLGHHAGLRPVVAGARGKGGTARGRRFWRRGRRGRCDRRRSAVSRARDDGERLRPGGNRPRPPRATKRPGALVAALPLVVVIAVNLWCPCVVLPRLDSGFLDDERWGGASRRLGQRRVVGARGADTGHCHAGAINRKRLPALRKTVDAGANASVLPVMSVASLVGFGAVVAAMPAFAVVRDWVLSIGGGPLVSLALATNILSALTGSASGGLTIALDALGGTYMQIAASSASIRR